MAVDLVGTLTRGEGCVRERGESVFWCAYVLKRDRECVCDRDGEYVFVCKRGTDCVRESKIESE